MVEVVEKLTVDGRGRHAGGLQGRGGDDARRQLRLGDRLRALVYKLER